MVKNQFKMEEGTSHIPNNCESTFPFFDVLIPKKQKEYIIDLICSLLQYSGFLLPQINILKLHMNEKNSMLCHTIFHNISIHFLYQ